MQFCLPPTHLSTSDKWAILPGCLYSSCRASITVFWPLHISFPIPHRVGGWVGPCVAGAGCISRWFACLKTVSNPSRATQLIRSILLQLRHANKAFLMTLSSLSYHVTLRCPPHPIPSTSSCPDLLRLPFFITILSGSNPNTASST